MRIVRPVRFGRRTEQPAPTTVTPAMRWFAGAYSEHPCTCSEMPIPGGTCAGCVARRWAEAMR
jgi:hypothetical protein